MCRLSYLITLLPALCLPQAKLWSRETNYIHYRWEQGFTAINGYALCQDRNGYIWIGTENGLMRFNGYDFKLYTTRDGLPDNEIFGFIEDKDGRLWLLPFANTLAYIRNGIIYNESTDTALRSNKLASCPVCVYFDGDGTSWIQERSVLTRHTTKGYVQKITQIDGLSLASGAKFWVNAKKELTVLLEGRMYCWRNNAFHRLGTLPFYAQIYAYADSVMICDFQIGKQAQFRNTPDSFIISVKNIPVLDSSGGKRIIRLSRDELGIGTDVGFYIFNIHSRLITDSFLTGCRVGAILSARDGAIWLGTTGKGIYRFLTTPVKSVKGTPEQATILYIRGTDKGMYATTDRSELIRAACNSRDLIETLSVGRMNPGSTYRHYVFMTRNSRGQWLCFTDDIQLKSRPGEKALKRYAVFSKTVLETGKDTLLVGSLANGIIRLEKERFELLDTLLPYTRIVALAKIQNVIYAGTLNGLMACHSNKRCTPVLPGNKLLQGHITALCTDESGILWVANNHAELIGLRNDRIVAVLGLKEGLQCNRISSLKASQAFIWVGTDNGLFAIARMPSFKIARHITYAKGLNSNQVTCLDVYGGRVWVGTINGVNYFDEADLFRDHDSTAIIVNSIRNGKYLLQPSQAPVRLNDKTLAVDFDVVDFSGGARPVFEYRINDHGEWMPLQGNQLYFPALPYGQFRLSIRAFSPNWTSGALFCQEFYHPRPFYLSAWFLSTMALASMTLVLLAVYLLLKHIRKRDQHKLKMQQNLLRLEQMALQGQMSPHFIFNCIAAIKQYYNVGAREKANSFVDAFSQLIRQTFEMGTETFVNLEQELNYLSRYLYLEKARFNDAFEFHIHKAVAQAENSIPVPAMLLQPVVENAVRHGVRHLPDGQGRIEIAVVQQGSQIEFTVTDNGIGRQKSKALNARFESVLTSSAVNEKRVHILRRLLNDSLTMTAEDVLNAQQEVCGTRVRIAYPIFINQLLKHESNPD